jgi:hypothetical protein
MQQKSKAFAGPSRSEGDLERAGPMRDLLLLLTPLVCVLYFLVFQDQFNAILSYIGVLIY